MGAAEKIEQLARGLRTELAKAAQGFQVPLYEAPELRQFSPLTVVDIDLRRTPIDQLEKLCQAAWTDVTEGPTRHYGNSAFNINDPENPAIVLANEGFLHLRTKIADPLPAVTRLYPLLNNPAVKSTGCALEVIGVASVPTTESWDINEAMLHQFPGMQAREDFWDETGIEIVGTGMAALLRHENTSYELTMNPIPEGIPTSHLLVSIKTRDQGQVTPFGLRRMVERQRTYFDSVMRTLPQTLLPAAA